jgi:hypothetical protein
MRVHGSQPHHDSALIHPIVAFLILVYLVISSGCVHSPHSNNSSPFQTDADLVKVESGLFKGMTKLQLNNLLFIINDRCSWTADLHEAGLVHYYYGETFTLVIGWDFDERGHSFVDTWSLKRRQSAGR